MIIPFYQFASVSSGISYSDSVLANNPICYYTFTETSGTSLSDSSGNNRTATLNSSLTTATALYSGKTLGALTFDGTSNDIGYSNSTMPIGSSGHSIEIIFKTSNANVGFCGFRNPKSTSPSSWDKEIGLNGSGQLFYYYFTGSQTTLTTSSSYNDNNPHHLVITHASNTPKIYVDGVLQITGSGNSFNFVNAFLAIGHITQTSRAMNGVIDELAVFNTVLTATEVSDRYVILTS